MSGFVLELPPLRNRKADIPLLVQRLVVEYEEIHKDTVTKGLKIPAGAVDVLFESDWSYNVRGLRGVVFKAAAYAENGCIGSLVLGDSTWRHKVSKPNNVIELNPQADTWEVVHDRTQAAYFRANRAAGGNTQDAIKRSGLSKARFHEIEKKLKDRGLL